MKQGVVGCGDGAPDTGLFRFLALPHCQMRCLLQQVVMERQILSLGLDRNVWPPLAVCATNLGPHFFSDASDRRDAFAARVQIILGDEHDPDGRSTSGILAEPKLDSSHAIGQGAVLPDNLMKQTSFITRGSAGHARPFRPRFRCSDHTPEIIADYQAGRNSLAWNSATRPNIPRCGDLPPGSSYKTRKNSVVAVSRISSIWSCPCAPGSRNRPSSRPRRTESSPTGMRSAS